MDHQFGTLLPVERHGLLQDLLGFVRASQLEKHPRMGVQIGRIVVGERHHAARHREGPFEIALLQREEIGVVVEHQGVVGTVRETALVSLVTLLHGLAVGSRTALLRRAALVLFGDARGGLLVPRVADHAPNHAPQRVGVGVAERLLVGFDRLAVLLRAVHHMPFRDVEIDLVGEEFQRLADVFFHRIGVLQIGFDVDHRPVEVLHGRTVSETALVERKGLFQFARGDQVVGVELHDAPILGIADRQDRGQVVQLEIVFAVEARVGGELFEALDLRFERQGVREKQFPGDGQQRAVILPSGVEIGQRHQRLYVRGVDLQRPAVLGEGQRVLAVEPVEVGQHDVVLRFVGCGFDHCAGFVDGFADLVRGHQHLPFHGAQQRDASETQLCRIERRKGHERRPLLFVEGRHDAVVVRVLRVVFQQAAVDFQRFVEAVGDDQRLSVELVVPFVRGVEPVGAAGHFDGLFGRRIQKVPGQFVPRRGIGRVVADRFEKQFPGPGCVARDDVLLDALGVEPHAAQRIGVSGRFRRALPGDERRKEEQAEKRCRCQAFHGRRGFRALRRTGGGTARRFRNRDAGPSRRI